MHQSSDLQFSNILRQLCEHQQTANDLQCVNSHVTSYHNIDFCGSTQMITKTNVLCHTVNVNIAFQYATFKSQLLHIFLFNHWVDTRMSQYGVDNSRHFTRLLSKQKLFDAFEIMNNTENHMSAYFLFISDMLMIVIKNIFQNLDVANNSVFITVDVILDLLSEQIELSNNMIIHSMLSIS